MNKISIIIRREYLTRVRKKSFIVMTVVGPALFAAMLIAPVWFATMEDDGVKQIAVLDSSQLFIHKIPETAKFRFTYAADVKLEDFKKNLAKTEYYGVLYIPPYVPYVPRGVEFYAYRQPPANLTMHLANAIEKGIETEKLKAHHIENLDEIIKSVKTHIDVRVFRMSESGAEKESHSMVSMGIAWASALLVYMFIFLFGTQVMRSVIEEKTSRIVEVIISSVKPFELMMGKVTGVALVGLTQFVVWIALTTVLVAAAKGLFMPDLTGEALQQAGNPQVIGSLANSHAMHSATVENARELMGILQSINFGTLIGSFIFFFIGGYLLYGSLFAAIGSAVDTDTDTQQFMVPVTIPLILSIMVMTNAMQDPDGQIAFWFSMIPLTSPMVMMARIPFGVPCGELALSMALLILAFTGAIWLSAKIYRTGILVYGKKLTYKELWKWLSYRS